MKTKELEEFFLKIMSNATEAANLARHVASECPWLNTSEEISTPIGIELLQASLDEATLKQFDLSSLISHHNECAQLQEREQLGFDVDAAYTDLSDLLLKADRRCGKRMHELFDESILTNDLIITQLSPVELDEEFKRGLKSFLGRYPEVRSIAICDYDGNEIYVID